MFTYDAEIDRVIDGDSIVLKYIDLGFQVKMSDVSVRLYECDTPESRTKDKVEKHYGLIAKNYVKNCLQPGQKVQIKTYLDRRGKFGRILGTIYDKGMKTASLNSRLIRDHMAVHYNGQAKSKVKAAHILNRKYIDLL